MEEKFVYQGIRWKLVLEGKWIIVYKYDKILDKYLPMVQAYSIQQARDYCIGYNRDNL